MDNTNVRLPDAWHEWTVTEKVGQGSFGTVYKAERKIGNETFVSAIKVVKVPEDPSETEILQRDLESEASVREYFRDIVDSYVSEIKTMDVLKGISNIVSVEDYAVEERPNDIGWTIYIRMEFLQSFSKYSAARKIDEQEAVRLGKDICTALNYCEKLHVLHRDIKPDNIFVSPLGHFKLGDFGVARQLDRTTATYSAKGTFSYMAPEVFKGQRYGVKADIYSLGIVLYRLMNRNREPFVDPYKQIIYYKDRDDALRRRMNGEIFPSPIEASAGFSQVILKACAYAPEDRYSSAAEMLEALNQLGESKSVLVSGLERKETEKQEPIGQEPKQHESEKQKSAVTGYREEKNSRKDKIWPWIAAFLVALLLVAGIGGNKIQDVLRNTVWGAFKPDDVATESPQEIETDADTPIAESSTEQSESEKQEPVYPSMDEAAEGTRQLMEQCWSYAGTDYDAFSALYRNTADEVIQSDFSGENPRSQFDSALFVPIASHDNFYLVNVVYYIVSGTYPDTSMSSRAYNVQVSYVNGEWKIDYSQGANDAIEEVTNNNPDLYPSGCIEAIKAGRNATIFAGYNYMYLDPTAVYSGCLNTEVKFAWQDKNGNLIVALWIANGTSGNRSIRTIDLVITDDELGEVVNVSNMEVNEAIRSVSGRLFEITIPADQVKTGTQTWGSLHNELHTTQI